MIPIGLALLSGEGRVRWANAELARLVGRNRDECIDRPFAALVGLPAEVRGFPAEARVRRADGEMVLLEITGGSPAEGEGGDSYRLVRDITHQRQAERDHSHALSIH